jgi:hypothetical protein
MAHSELNGKKIMVNGKEILYQTALNDISDLQKKQETNPNDFSSDDAKKLNDLKNSVNTNRNTIYNVKKTQQRTGTGSKTDINGGKTNAFKTGTAKNKHPTKVSTSMGIPNFLGSKVSTQIETGTVSYLKEEIASIIYLIEYMDNNNKKQNLQS